MNKEISDNVLRSNTSLVGIKCKDGIVMAADKRSTAGGMIMNKNSKKIRFVTENIIASYTGTVSDIELTNKVLKAELRLKELKTHTRPTIEEAASLLTMTVYRNIRQPSMVPSMVGTLISGVNEDGSTVLFTIEPAGSAVLVENYDANFSSGMPYILGLLENRYHEDITVKEAVDLAKDCIKAAIERDSGSGNGIDVFTVTKSGVKQVISETLVAQAQ